MFHDLKNTKEFLFLDDQRNPDDAYLYDEKLKLSDICKVYEWNIVRSYKEFVEWIEANGIPLVVSFDHDLHDEHIRSFLSSYRCGVIEYGNFKEKTGKHCADYLVEKCKKMNVNIPICYVHSANPIGRANIKEVLSL